MPSSFVLVVDTSPVSWQRVSRAIQGTAAFAMSARSVGEAESAARAGEIAVVVGSMRLPDGGGYELARRVRAIRPGTPVLLLADGPDRYDPIRGSAAGVMGALDWPCPVDRLRDRLLAALAEALEPLESATGTLDVVHPPWAGDDAGAPEAVPADALTALEATPIEPVPLDAIAALDAHDRTPVEPITVEAPPALPERSSGRPPPPQPAAEDERIATFLPRDWRTYPPVRVDPSVIQPAVERAIIELLPEVLDTVLRRLLASSPALRDLVEAAVDETVRAQVEPIARSVVRERLAEIEASAEDGS